MSKPFIVTASAAIPWRKSKFAEGVYVKDLGTSDGQAMQLVRCERGARFPWHRHADPEFIYVIAGKLFSAGSDLVLAMRE
jgi:quercetin dioxygenase-like cupin family protein